MCLDSSQSASKQLASGHDGQSGNRDTSKRKRNTSKFRLVIYVVAKKFGAQSRRYMQLWRLIEGQDGDIEAEFLSSITGDKCESGYKTWNCVRFSPTGLASPVSALACLKSADHHCSGYFPRFRVRQTTEDYGHVNSLKFQI